MKKLFACLLSLALFGGIALAQEAAAPAKDKKEPAKKEATEKKAKEKKTTKKKADEKKQEEKKTEKKG